MVSHALYFTVLNIACFFCACAQPIRFRVKEEQPPGTFVGSLAASDWLQSAISDEAKPSLRYAFLSSGMSHSELFTINSTTGVVRTSQALDRELLCGLYSLACELTLAVAAQSALSQFFRMTPLIVEVEDVNDNAPEFPKRQVRLDVPEDVAVNTTLALTAAVDQDTGEFGVQGYSLIGGAVGTLAISVAEAQDGRQKVNLLVKSPLDREVTSIYRVTVVAQDGGDPPKTGTMTVDINVIDVNDNPPVFHPASYNVSLDETTPLNTFVVRFNTTDADKEANGERRYRFSPVIPPEITKYFALNSSTGELRVADSLAEIQGQTIQITVECSDGGQPPLVGEAIVEVSVTDSGNTRPRAILNLLFDGRVSEYAQPGTVVAHVRVVDPDKGLQGVVTCSVVSEALELQALDVDQYKVIVVKALDREKQGTHNVSINCRDAGSPPLETSVNFAVQVVDENDNPPRFLDDVYYAIVSENNEIGMQIARVFAADLDIGKNAEIEYDISSTSGDAGVIIDDSGYIIATRSFDHERNHQITFDVIATDGGEPKRRSSATVILSIQDINDVTPRFIQDYYEVRVAENSPLGMTVGRVSADDRDSGDNGRLKYSLDWESPQERNFFSSINRQLPLAVLDDGTLTLEMSLDREATPEYSLLVRAVDGGKPARTGSARIIIIVEDVNDNPPQIIVPDPNNISALAVATDTKPGSTLLVVVARDIDDPEISQLHFHLVKATPFVRVNGENGVLALSRKLTMKDIGKHRVTVAVTDSGIPSKTSNASFDLMVFVANATEGPSSGERSEHLLIVIILGCVTGIITVAVIVTIIVIRRADLQRRKYSERDEMKPASEKVAVELGSALIVTNSSPEITIKKSHSHASSREGMGEDDFMPDKSFSAGSVSQESHQNGGAEDGHWSKALRLHQDLLKLHGVDPGFLLQPDDGNSDASGESTACDSGRGGSEEDSHSLGRSSPPVSAVSDLRFAPGSKLPRHSTFHPAGVSRTLRSNPPLSRHPQSKNPALLSSPIASASSWTDNGNPVKKVSFHDDVARGPTLSTFQRVPATDRWQSPTLLVGLNGDGSHPATHHHRQSPSHNPYGSLKRHYNNLSPRVDLDGSVETIDDNTSTTTSGSYAVDLESVPPRGRMSHSSVDHHAVV